MTEYIKTFIVATIGGCFMWLINAPLPWTLGPIVFISVVSYWRKKPLVWNSKIRNTALILLGYGMGRSFTADMVYTIGSQLHLMMMAALLTVGAGIATAWLIYKKAGIDFTSCLLGCVPGGLSQMVVLADEIEGADLMAVTIMQTLRMLSVVFTIPFLTIHVLSDGVVDDVVTAAGAVASATSYSDILMFAAVAIAGALVGKLIHLPTATLLGSLLGTAVFVVATESVAPMIPKFYFNLAQILVGSFIGTSVDLNKIRQYKSMLQYLLPGVLMVLLVSMGSAIILTHITTMDYATAFLGTAPGGLSEMGITSLTVGADSATMTAYQLARLLFIMLVFPYIAKTIVRYHRAHQTK